MAGRRAGTSGLRALVLLFATTSSWGDRALSAVSSSCEHLLPARPARPPSVPPSLLPVCLSPPPLLRLSLPILFSLLPPSLRRVPSAPLTPALFSYLIVAPSSSHLPWGCLLSRFFILSLSVLLSLFFSLYSIFSFSFLISALQFFSEIPIDRKKNLFTSNLIYLNI